MIRRFDLLLVPLIVRRVHTYTFLHSPQSELIAECHDELQTITTTLGALDKVAVGQADIYGMATDAHLVGQQYSC